jgi:hypothetical protein
LVAGLARLLLSGTHNEFTGMVLLLGCGAAGLLAGTVKLILHLARTHTGEHIA